MKTLISTIEEDGYIIKKFSDGTIIKELISENIQIDTNEEVSHTDRIEELKQQNYILMDALATIYEELLLREVL